MLKPHNFSEIIAEIVNWRALPPTVIRLGDCACGQSLRAEDHDEDIHAARLRDRHQMQGERE